MRRVDKSLRLSRPSSVSNTLHLHFQHHQPITSPKPALNLDTLRHITEIIHLQSQDQESLISASETTITQLKNEVEDVRWKLEEERRRFREEGRGREEVMGGMQVRVAFPFAPGCDGQSG